LTQLDLCLYLPPHGAPQSTIDCDSGCLLMVCSPG
jgi:hypothetical protein